MPIKAILKLLRRTFILCAALSFSLGGYASDDANHVLFDSASVLLVISPSDQSKIQYPTDLVLSSYDPSVPKMVYSIKGKAGYHFTHWYATGRISSTSFVDQCFGHNETLDVKLNFNQSSDSNFRLKLDPKFAPNVYKINLHTDDTAAVWQALDVTFDAAPPTLPTPTRIGYTFKEWRTEPDGEGTKYSAPATYTTVGNTELYAVWTPIRVSVTYDWRDAKGTKATSSYDFDSFYPYPTPSWEHHTFRGWSFDEAGEKMITEHATRITNPFAHTLYANWETETVTITYDADGGTLPSGIVNPLTLEWGDPLPLPIPTKTYWKFLGWNDGSNLLATGATASHTTTLTAKWEVKKATIKYMLDKNTVHATKENPLGQAYSFPSKPTKTGYEFSCWLDEEGAEVSASDFPETEEERTFFASFTPKTYTVTFDPNGGKLEEAPCTRVVTFDGKYTGEETTLPNPTRTGYTFAGWWTTSSSGGVEIGEDTKVDTDPAYTRLYAHWTANTYKVTFNATPGEVVGSSDLTVTYNLNYGTLPSAKRTGYTLAGWYTSIDNSGSSIYDSTMVKITAAQTLYAHWTPIKVKIHYMLDADTLYVTKENPFDQAYSFPSKPTKTGYEFSCWLDEEGAEVSASDFPVSEEERTFFASFTPKTYTVNFDPRGGELAEALRTRVVTFGGRYTGEATTLPKPTRTGYKFDDWWTTPSSGGKKIGITSKVDTDPAYTWLYARWTAKTFDVYYFGDDDEEPYAVVENTYDYPWVFPEEAPTKKGYAFRGWYTEREGRGNKISSGNFSLVDDVSLYAYFTQNTYKIKFDSNSGLGNMADQTAASAFPVSLNANTFTRVGYTFAGWAKSAAGNVAYQDGASVTDLAAPDALITLYAQWSANKYTVRFDTDGAETSVEDLQCEYDEKDLTFPAAPTKTGFTFLGWQFGEMTYAPGAKLENLSDVSGATLEVKALWEEHAYSILFDKNSDNAYGTMEAESDILYSEAFTLPDCAFRNPGHKFVGWRIGDEESLLSNEAEVSMLSAEKGASVTLKAVWEASYANEFSEAAHAENLDLGKSSQSWYIDSKSGKLTAKGGLASDYLDVTLRGKGVLSFTYYMLDGVGSAAKLYFIKKGFAEVGAASLKHSSSPITVYYNIDTTPSASADYAWVWEGDETDLVVLDNIVWRPNETYEGDDPELEPDPGPEEDPPPEELEMTIKSLGSWEADGDGYRCNDYAYYNYDPQPEDLVLTLKGTGVFSFRYKMDSGFANLKDDIYDYLEADSVFSLLIEGRDEVVFEKATTETEYSTTIEDGATIHFCLEAHNWDDAYVYLRSISWTNGATPSEFSLAIDIVDGKPVISVLGADSSKVKIKCCADLAVPKWIDHDPDHDPAQHSKCRFFRGTLP